jgi:hypothetical protein
MSRHLFSFSVHLNVDVNVTHKFQGGEEGYRAEHQKENVTRQYRIAEEFERL